MKIITRKIFNSETDKEKSIIDIQDNIINIKYQSFDDENICELDMSISININDFFSPHDIKGVHITNDNTLSIPLSNPITRGQEKLFLDVNNLKDKPPIIFIYFGEQIEDILIISTLPVEENNIPVALTDLKTNSDIIIESYPNYSFLKKKKLKKRKILLDLDCNSSLSGLEPQVDYLTMILKDIIYNNEDIKNKLIKKYPNLEMFFNVCDTENILNIKPEDKIFDEIKVQKELIRQKQSEYYEVKNG